MKQNGFKMSFESRCVRYFSNMLWETVLCRRSCVGKASLLEFDACPWSLIFDCTAAKHQMGLFIINWDHLLPMVFYILSYYIICNDDGMSVPLTTDGILDYNLLILMHFLSSIL